jgi:DNA-binding CsgD family transcriptional regulator
MARDGACFSIDPAGSIQLPDAQGAKQLRKLVGVCTAVSSSRTMLAGGSFTVARPGASSLVVTVMPYRREEGLKTFRAETSRAVVTFFDPDAPRLDSRRQLRDMYGLSAAEADVCWRIANGETPADIAANMGSTRETVRSQIKRIFAKTGTNRQPDLVRLVLLGPAVWSRNL